LGAMPKRGLIVSCYLESMEGCEKAFIDAVAKCPGVVGLRVEGVQNIRYARREYSDLWIIGLVKTHINGDTIITTCPKEGDIIMDAGADMVATEKYIDFLDAGVPYPIMADMNWEEYMRYMGNGSLPRHIEKIIDHEVILATTREKHQLDFAAKIREDFYGASINIEGGISSPYQVKVGLEKYEYVTIGKAINDPPFIIRRLLHEVFT